jgi:hypothetical protein
MHNKALGSPRAVILIPSGGFSLPGPIDGLCFNELSGIIMKYKQRRAALFEKEGVEWKRRY